MSVEDLPLGLGRCRCGRWVTLTEHYFRRVCDGVAEVLVWDCKRCGTQRRDY